MAIVGTGVTYDLGLSKYHRTTQEILTLLLVSRDRPLPDRNSGADVRRNLRGTTRISGIVVQRTEPGGGAPHSNLGTLQPVGLPVIEWAGRKACPTILKHCRLAHFRID